MSERSKKQLDRMFEVMTAQERAVHILQAWKADRDEEPLVRKGTPVNQGRDLSELLAMVRCVNHEFATLALVYEQVAERLRLRFAWFVSMRAWAMSAQSLAQALLLLVPEPITESERDARVEELRAEEFTLKEAAQFLAEIEDEDGGNWATQLKTAIEAGQLKATGQGRALRIGYGDLCDWRGESVPLIPEWGFDVQVLPDEEVEQRRRHRESARRVLERSPTLLASFAPLPDELPEGVNGANNAAIGLASLLRLELPLHWRDIRALEMVIEEVQDRLGGEDPADEILRSALDDAKTAVQEAVDGLAECEIEVELLEPEDADLMPLRELMERAVDNEMR